MKENPVSKILRAIGNALMGTKDKATIETSKAREDRAVGTITASRRKPARVAATATACALLLLAPGCAAVKGWLAGGPEIELSAAIGPAKLGITLNPGKTVVDAATALANAGESLAGVTGAIEPVPAE